MPDRSYTAFVGAALCIVCLGGCFGEKPSHWRLIPSATLPPLPRAELVREEAVGAWPAEVGQDPRTGWAGPGLDGADDDAILLALPPGGAQDFTRVVRVEAGEVDTLVVRTSASVRGLLSLYWTAPEDRFGQDRSMLAEHSVLTPDGDYETRFAVRGAPGWQGTIGRTRLILRAVRGEAVAVSFRGLEARRSELRPDPASDLAAGQWRVQLDDETRDGFPCVPGQPRRWEVPEEARGSPAHLRFSHGTEVLAGGSVRFEIRAATEASTEPLWAREVGANGEIAGRWHDVSLDLEQPPSALWFTCEHVGGEPATRGIPLWAAPVLSALDHRQRQPNIVLVSIDTLRPDRLSLYGYPRQTSPQLDRWAQDAVVFEHAVTSAPWTLPAHLSMLSGLDATRHGVNHPVRVPETVPLVAELLRDAGYQTVAWVGGGFMSPRFGLDRGFDRYRSWPNRAGEAELEDGLARALSWLEAEPTEPFFLFFHTYETHYPYRPREPFYSRWAPDETRPGVRDLAYISDHGESFQLEKLWRYRDGAQRRPLTEIETLRLSALYDSGVAYADEQVGRLLTRLAEAPFGDNTAIVVTSDHGEALGEKGRAGHAYLEDFNSLVPLILRLPDGSAVGRVPSQVRIADVAPTLLELAGISPPPGVDGESLISLTNVANPPDRSVSTYAAFSNRGLAVRPDRRWKLVFVDAALAPLAGLSSLYDLENDPAETTPVIDPARSRSLARQAQREIAEMRGVVRIHLENRSAATLEGRLTGPDVGPLQIKVAQPSAAVVTLDDLPGVHWSLAAGGRVTLMIQNPRQANLSIEVEGHTVASLGAPDLVAGWSAHRIGGEWISGSDGGDAAIAVEWPEGLAGLASDPTTADDALLRQLEALGYVQ